MLYKSINDLMGFRLVESEAVVKDVQRRTHKKKRINKKWLKKYGTIQVPDYGAFYVSTVDGAKCIIAQPKTIKKIIDAYGKRFDK